MKIKINSRVMWFKYSIDGIIIKSGFGTVLGRQEDHPFVFGSIVILCDSGNIKAFPEDHVTLYEDWNS